MWEYRLKMPVSTPATPLGLRKKTFKHIALWGFTCFRAYYFWFCVTVTVDIGITGMFVRIHVVKSGINCLVVGSVAELRVCVLLLWSNKWCLFWRYQL